MTLVTATLLAVAACGSDSDQGVDANKKLSEFSDADFTAACNELGAALSAAAKEGQVRVECFGETQPDGAACNQDSLTSCIEQTDKALCELPNADDPLRACEATFGQMKPCFVALIGQFDQYATLTCDSDLNDFEELVSASELTACDAVLAVCPDVFGGQEG